jgi:hypothetical protein
MLEGISHEQIAPITINFFPTILLAIIEKCLVWDGSSLKLNLTHAGALHEPKAERRCDAVHIASPMIGAQCRFEPHTLTMGRETSVSYSSG